MDVVGAITDAANQNGVDPQFALSIAHAESGLNPAAKSPAGAIGVMQLMPATAKGLGVDPTDTAQNIQGGVKYLAQLGKRFNGDPELVAAAYNAGPGAVEKHGGVPPYPETQAYVRRVTGSQPIPPSGAGSAGDDLPSADAVLRSIAGTTPSAAPNPQAQEAPLPSADTILKNVGMQGAQGRDLSAPAPKPVSPSMKAAQAQAKATVGSGGDVTQGGAQFANSALLGSLPLIEGGLAAGGVGLRNALAGMGVGKAAGYSPGEAFQATRDAASGASQAFGQAHPMVNAGLNVAGMVASAPATGLEGLAERGAAAVAPKAAASLVGRLATKAVGAGAVGGVYGGLDSASQGEDAKGILTSAGTSAALSAPFGVAGEGVNALSGLAKGPVASRLVRPVSGAATGALAGYMMGGKAGAEGGAVAGLLGSRIGRAPDSAESTPADRDAALDILAKRAAPTSAEAAPADPDALGPLTPNARPPLQSGHLAAADALDASHASAMTAEGLGKPGVALAADAIKGGGSVPDLLASAMQDRDASTVDRVAQGVSATTGINPAAADSDAARQVATLQSSPRGSAQMVSELAAQQHPAAVLGRVGSDIAGATGVTPESALASVDAETDAARQGPAKEAYDAALTGAPMHTPALQALAMEPEVRNAMNQARRLMGSDAMVPNADATTSTGAAKVTPADYQAYLRTGDESHLGGAPKEVPTDKMMDLSKKMLDKSITRDQFGEAERTPENALRQNWSAKLRDAMDAANPLYAKARGIAGDYLQNQQASELGRKLWAGGGQAEAVSDLRTRMASMSPGERAATQKGYLGEQYRRMERGGVNLGQVAESPFHQGAREALFGQAPANAMRESLRREATLARQKPAEGADQQFEAAHAAGRDLWSGASESLGPMREAFNGLAPENQQAQRMGYLGELHRRVERGTLDFGKVASSPYHQGVQDALFGADKAAQLREGLQREQAFRDTAKELGKVKVDAPRHDETLAQSLMFGVMEHGVHPAGLIQSVAAGAGIKGVRGIVDAIKDGKMTPGVRNALGELLAQDPHTTAAELRRRDRTRQLPVKLSDRTRATAHVIRRAGIVAGHAGGMLLSNALQGL